jgi:hypothetical protein
MKICGKHQEIKKEADAIAQHMRKIDFYLIHIGVLVQIFLCIQYLDGTCG